MQNSVACLTGPRQIHLQICPRDVLGPGHVRIRTFCSGLSAGTELTLYQGSNPRLKDWDPDRRMFVDRIQLVAAQVPGDAPAPGIAGRWTGTRIARMFMELVADRVVDPFPLISHVVDADEVADAFALLDRNDGSALQVVLRFT